MNCNKVSPGLIGYYWRLVLSLKLSFQKTGECHNEQKEGGRSQYQSLRDVHTNHHPRIWVARKKWTGFFMRRVIQQLGWSVKDKWCQRRHEEESLMGLMFSNHPLNTLGERKTQKAPWNDGFGLDLSIYGQNMHYL